MNRGGGWFLAAPLASAGCADQGKFLVGTEVWDLTGFSPLQLLLAVLIIFTAGVVRGFSGFGFSMVAVTGLSLLRPPAEVVPMVLMLEMLASVHLLPSVWHHIDWRSLRLLLAGMVGATPVGVWLLASVPADQMRVVVSLLVVTAAAALWSGWRMQRPPGAKLTLATGALSGFLNGTASIAGPPVILFYFSSPSAVDVSRASLIAFFLGTDLIALAFGGVFGLVRGAAFARTAVLVLPVALGVALGRRCFGTTNPEVFRRLVLVLLMALSAAGLIRALAG
ncbi:MAG: sulfite exporter TauE/SafE family protein [Deltaproteobacteria bacterium]|nr:sulfite exporter TauE/SafE family protein [Deltaproteobacteria bacterium]